jgi:hypothetical protein
MTSLAVFKLTFATIYCLKWNVRQCCCPYYRKSKANVEAEFKRLKKDKNGNVSSDEEEDEVMFT